MAYFLTQIINEAWIDKFYQFFKENVTPRTTLRQLCKSVEKQFDVSVRVKFVRPNVPTIDKSVVLGAEVFPFNTDDNKHEIVLQVSNDVGYSTPAIHIKELLTTLRHELAHVRQMSHGAMFNLPYTAARHDKKQPDDSNMTMVQYVLQPVERAIQADDVGEGLASIGKTPDDFKRVVDYGANRIKQGVPYDKVEMEVWAKLLPRSEWDSNKAAIINYTISRALALALVKGMKPMLTRLGYSGPAIKQLTSEYNNKADAFIRRLYKNFNKNKAYTKQYYTSPSPSRFDDVKVAWNKIINFIV